MRGVTQAEARKWVGKHIYAVRKNGSVITGKLVRISGDRFVLEQPKGKQVRTKAILPLVLFDLLAIGAYSSKPYGYGGYGGGYGHGGYAGYGGGYGGGYGTGYGGGYGCCGGHYGNIYR
ncbi:hypothetical protein [Paenibacillus taiwanensis]|uniref:hypothetical protein n=1 Tax=Paenibacillus taiwanensis TaxID=401638 RepID=UPI000417E756|nr:hypothetical protein [Paenibacillus taiwanensis]